METTIFWNVTPCNLVCTYQRCGGTSASTFMVKQVRGPSDALVHISQATRRHIPEDRNASLTRGSLGVKSPRRETNGKVHTELWAALREHIGCTWTLHSSPAIRLHPLHYSLSCKHLSSKVLLAKPKYESVWQQFASTVTLSQYCSWSN
jgi:hypothetical protein